MHAQVHAWLTIRPKKTQSFPSIACTFIYTHAHTHAHYSTQHIRIHTNTTMATEGCVHSSFDPASPNFRPLFRHVLSNSITLQRVHRYWGGFHADLIACSVCARTVQSQPNLHALDTDTRHCQQLSRCNYCVTGHVTHPLTFLCPH